MQERGACVSRKSETGKVVGMDVRNTMTSSLRKWPLAQEVLAKKPDDSFWSDILFEMKELHGRIIRHAG